MKQSESLNKDHLMDAMRYLTNMGVAEPSKLLVPPDLQKKAKAVLEGCAAKVFNDAFTTDEKSRPSASCLERAISDAVRELR